MHDFLTWKRAFLGTRSLDRPDGRRLFAYRATQQEYETLRGLFRQLLQALHGHRWTPSTAECACLVLYASEWWRREYAGGAWNWDALLSSLESNIDLPHAERSDAVERGLRVWGHQPGDTGKRFFGAIVAQGGLPMRVLASGTGALPRLLAAGLRQAHLYRWDDAQLEAMFAAEETQLVHHLRHPEIHHLLAAMVRTVLDLRAQFGLAGQADPVALLQQREPRWRDRFPIDMADAAAQALLTGLVQAAARAPDAPAHDAHPVTALRSLQPDDEGGFTLQMLVSVPGSVATEALARACELKPEAVPLAFVLELAGPQGRVPLCRGRQALGSGGSRLVLGGCQRLHGEAAAAEALLALRAPGRDAGMPAPIPGADALDAELPWVFAGRDTGAALVAAGACRLAEEHGLVAVREGETVRPAGPGSLAVPRGALHGLEAPRRVFEFSGTVLVEGPAGTFRLQTRQAAAPAEVFVWRGTRLPWPTRPVPAWLGVPRLYRVTVEGEEVRVPEAAIEWREPGTGGARISALRWQGPAEAWLVQDGERQRRFRMVLLGADAALAFHSGASDREGAIELLDWGVDWIAAPQALLAHKEVEPGRAAVALCAPQRAPAEVALSVAWPRGRPFTLLLSLPFPAAGGRFVGLGGQPLGEGAAVSLRQLREVRVQVVDLNPQKPHRYWLDVELAGTARGTSRLHAQQEITLDQGLGELRLLEIEPVLRGLLGHSDELDARLALRLLCGGACVAQLSLIRYDAALERDGAAAMQLERDRLATEEREALQGMRLSALSLLHPEEPERALVQSLSEGVPAGRWELAALSAELGPWLVFPTPDSSLQLRPTLFPGFSIGLPLPRSHRPCPLAEAMAIVERGKRLAALQGVAAEMGADLRHRSWALIVRQHRSLGHLPLNSLDYWRAIAREPAACVAAVLKLAPPDVPALMQLMRTDLGVMWELIPLRVLRALLRHFLDGWPRVEGVADTAALARMVAAEAFGRLGLAEPLLADMVQLALFEEGCNFSVERLAALQKEVGAGPRALRAQLWEGSDSLLQRLLMRGHDGDKERWPQFGLTLVQGLVEELLPLAPQWAGRLTELLWLPGGHAPAHRGDVANAPLLAGLLSELSPSDGWWAQGQRLAQLRQVRHFDPAWFEAAFRIGRAIALHQRQPAAAAPAPSRSASAPAATALPPPTVAVAEPAAVAVAAAPVRPPAVAPWLPASRPAPPNAAAPVAAPAAAAKPAGPSYGQARRVPRDTGMR